MADTADPIECSLQPLGFSFHPTRRVVAAGLVDGTLELHNFSDWPDRMTKKVTAKKSSNGDEESNNGSDDEEDDTIFASLPIHVDDFNKKLGEKKGGGSRSQKPSCRSVLFNDDGTRLYAAGNGGGLAGLDAEMICSSSASVLMDDSGSDGTCKGQLWRVDGASPKGINRIFQMPEASPAGRLLVTGDDEGVVRLWDERMCCAGGGTGILSAKAAASASPSDAVFPRGCVLSWSEQNDYISGLDAHKDGTTLLASSADCTLGIYDIRKSAVKSGNPGKGSKPRLSDDQEDELLSVITMKHGRKVVCGTGEGVLAVWSWGTWGDVSDRFPGHPNSIDALLKIDEDTLITGSGDGIVRIVTIQPDKLLGVLGDHDGFPVEALSFTSDREYVASLSHDALIRMWDASLLRDGDDDDDDDDESDQDESGERKKTGDGDSFDVMKKAGTGIARAAADSDDEWNDDDDSDGGDDDKDQKKSAKGSQDDSDDSDDVDDSDSDDDSDDDRGGKKPRLAFKTEAEKFFEDL